MSDVTFIEWERIPRGRKAILFHGGKRYGNNDMWCWQRQRTGCDGGYAYH